VFLDCADVDKPGTGVKSKKRVIKRAIAINVIVFRYQKGNKINYIKLKSLQENDSRATLQVGPGGCKEALFRWFN
jgi:hypothetical protein